MYTWIWRHLPGPTALRLFQALLLIAAVSLVLLFVIGGVLLWRVRLTPQTS